MSTKQKFIVVLSVLAVLMTGSWGLGWNAAQKSIPQPIVMTPEAYLDALAKAEARKAPLANQPKTLRLKPAPAGEAVTDPFVPLGTSAKVTAPQ